MAPILCGGGDDGGPAVGRTALLLLLLGVRVASSINSYFGDGWEDPVTKQQLYKGLPILMDEQSAAAPEYAEVDLAEFNWRQFEADGGRTRVRGIDGWTPQPVQSWSPRYDAVQHGYYMLYRFDDQVTTNLNGSMADHFFSITVDVNVHPEYAASDVGQLANSSLRLSIFEFLCNRQSPCRQRSRVCHPQ